MKLHISMAALLIANSWVDFSFAQAPAPPVVAASEPVHEYIIRYDEKCMAAAVRACQGGVDPIWRPGPNDSPLRCPANYTSFGMLKCVNDSAIRACRELVSHAPPVDCERKELTESGWRNLLQAQFLAVALELQRACVAAGKKPEDCARPAAALPTPIKSK